MQLISSPHASIALAPLLLLLTNDSLQAQPAKDSVQIEGELMQHNVVRLGSSSYRTRQRASQWLLEAGDTAVGPLESALDHRDAEVRLQCHRLLKEIQENKTRLELTHLMTRYDPDRTYRLAGWQPFRQACGDDTSARGLYQRLLQHDASFMAWLGRVDDDPSYDIENQLEDQQRYLSPSSEHLRSGNTLTWSMMLLAGTNAKICQVPVLGSHIRCGLQSGPTIHNLTQGANRDATMRLVRSWIVRQSTSYASRSTLRIAMLYKCDELSHQLALATLGNRSSPPASVQTALLFLATHQPETARAHLTVALQDQRVCQIWQIASLRRRAIQTQVRDTALALMLHLQGIDPRSVGYQDIQADPITLFGEQTLGFETDEQRTAAHEKGLRLLKEIATFGNLPAANITD